MRIAAQVKFNIGVSVISKGQLEKHWHIHISYYNSMKSYEIVDA